MSEPLNNLNEERRPYLRGEMSSILTSLGEGVVISDEDENVIFMNPAAEELLTVKEEDFLGKPIWDCHRNIPIVETAIAESRSGPVRREATCTELGKTFKLNIATVTGEDGGRRGSAMVIHDFTMEKKLQNDLLDSNRELTLRQDKLDYQLKVAREIQRALLPPNVTGGRFSFWGEVSQASGVGGAFSLYTPLENGRIFLAVGDVVGKGVPAALVMTFVMNVLSASAKELGTPATILKDINRKLIESMGEELNVGVSLCALVLDGATGGLIYAGAAFEPPIWLKSDESCELLRTEGFALGSFLDNSYEEKRIVLGRGDRIVLFTDGVVDAKNARGEYMGERRWYTLARRSFQKRGADFLGALLREVKSFSAPGPQTDDIAILVLEYHG